MKEQLKQLIQEVREDGPPSSPEWVEACDVLESKLDTFSPWISVEDALPEEDGNSSIYCLVYDKCYGAIVRPFNEFHNCWDDEDGDDNYCVAKGGDITHWMPLPQPPKSPKE